MKVANDVRVRWAQHDWVELAAARLSRDGPAALTLEALCAAAARTRGSFYHHFPTVDALLAQVAQRWRRTETEEVGAASLADPDPRKALRALARRSEQMDHGLEIGIRGLAAASGAVAAIVREVDAEREAILTRLMQAAYALPADRAADVARIFHSLQLAAQLRAPDDVGGFQKGAARRLTAWLERDAAAG
jgi:AcrR family transcriptional regulator